MWRSNFSDEYLELNNLEKPREYSRIAEHFRKKYLI